MGSSKASNSVDILVVEDSPTQAEQLRHLLAERGFQVRVAPNGREALAAMRDRKPALVISDVVMPEMDGYTLCKTIKSEAALKDIPVILVTSLSHLEDVVKGVECGADNFIKKPYDEKSLLARVDYILLNRELRGNAHTEFGVEIYLAGQKHYITSERRQILDLLISTYEEAVRMNDELEGRQRELARSYQLLDLLYRMAASLNYPTGVRDAAFKAMEHALQFPGVESGWMLVKEHGETFRTAAAGGLPAGVDVGCATGKDCLCLGKLLSGELRQAANILECDGFPELQGQARSVRRHAAVPLWCGGRSFGVMNLVGTDQRLFSDADLKILSGMGDQVAVALERAELLEDLETKVEERTSALTEEISERQRVAEALRESEERLRLLLDSTAGAIFGQDPQGNCTFCNPSCLRLLGYKEPDDLLGRDMHALVHHTRPDGTPCPARECRLHNGFRKGEGAHVDDEVFWRADGTSFPVEYWSHPVRRNGQIVGSVVAFLDISERRSLEQQLRQSQKMEAVGQLAGGIAHDFNNLLTVIKGYGEVLLDELSPDNKRLHRAADEIYKAADRAASLTRQLLAFSRRQVLESRVLDLNAVVGNMDKMLRRLIGEDIELVSLQKRDLGPVKADPGQIEQILMNLAVNARDAMPQGGKLTIETANVELDEAYVRNHVAVQPGPYVMLAVSDTGCGMDAETQSRIFEPFFTTKEPGKGTGLGLATVYGIVKQSGGNIWAYSEPGHGTTLKIYLPRVEEAVEPPVASKPAAEVPRGSETVLLVEDEEAVRQLVSETLRRYGYTVVAARNGAEAVEAAQQHPGPIHVLATDVVMPGGSGRQVAQRLTPLRPEMKVLFMSGYTDDAIVQHGVLEPGTAFLQKPFRPADLARKIREVLDAGKPQ